MLTLTSHHQSADDQVYFRFDFASTQNGLQCQQRARFTRAALYHLDGEPKTFVAGSCRASAPK
jgi:hypothetical protein